jgi:hypothetical protein
MPMQRLKALIAQLLGACVAVLVAHQLKLAALWPIVITQAVMASVFSRLLKQPSWWVPIHLSLAPLAASLLLMQLPPWIYLGAALVMGLVFWGTLRGDVPLFLSSPAVAASLGTLVDQEQARHIVDLGAGTGSVAAPLASNFPEVSIEAWERAPIPWAILRWKARGLPNLSAIRHSFWDCDLSTYDMVYVFLSPEPMPRLGEKAKREMRSGSLLVSSMFPIPDWSPETILHMDDRMHTTLYCYRIAS